ncbi:MAG TPA: endonuclease/exonuclease/phosphatase family protein [Gemmataceae bacterium]|nr:endonuclease/exonuclease/phosphatase family protein [Gemmataceae bacterium]
MGSTDVSRAAPQVGPGRRLLGRLLWLCSWSYLAVALGLWALLRWADLWWPASVFLFAPRWLCALPLLALLPAAGLLRRKGLLVPLGLAAAVIAGPVTGLCVPWRPLLSPAPAGPRLRLVTCNLHGSEAVEPHRLEALVQGSGADVVVLQEWPEAEASSLGTEPGWHRHATPRLFLASRFPIRRVIELGRNSYEPEGSVACYDLDTPAGVVHLFSLHLASPRDSLYAAVHEDRKGAAEVAANSALRREQSEYVARHTAGLGGPVLLAGDFNTPPESALFREVWGDYTDAFGAAGWGWGYTFAGGKTRVRIDHVLAGRGWHCDRCRVGPHVGSPHRPVVADLIWSREQF